MSLNLSYLVCRRLIGIAGRDVWRNVRIVPKCGVYYSAKPTIESQRASHQPEQPPENFDGGDYDEEKNQEYEQEAEMRAKRIRRIKKVLSSAMFVSVLGYVGWSRRTKRQEIASNIKDAKFLNDDGLFKGSERFCVYNKPGNVDTKVVLPVSMLKDGTIKRIEKLDVRDGDIIVASFPKAGTTWVQEIVYLINNDLNFEEAQQHVLESRFPFLEYPFPGLSTVEKMPSPRLMKTHLPFDFLPESSAKAKLIYVARNPKDIVISYYHFARMFSMSNFIGSFDEFLRKFENDELPYCPFFDHVESFLRHKDDPNLLIVTYEDLSQDPAEVIQKVARFLGKSLSDEDVQKLVDHTSFTKMRENPSVNYEHWDELGLRNQKESKFMRKGIVGDWRNVLNKSDNEKFDEWIQSGNKMRFPFIYE